MILRQFKKVSPSLTTVLIAAAHGPAQVKSLSLSTQAFIGEMQELPLM